MESAEGSSVGGAVAAKQVAQAAKTNVAMAKTALDVEKQQGAQVVDMIRNAGASINVTA